MVTIIRKGTSAEEIKKKMQKAVSKARGRGIMKYAGKIKFTLDPLVYQKKIRDEWR